MKYLTANQIRQKFVDFFVENQHQLVDSFSLVPAGDKSLLFTNSGMAQFKDVFLGYEKRSYSRAVSVQRCLRVGGKHNDLDNVGYTSRHHTFFEMLGNFSFGDYFKDQAIVYAWSFLTKVLEIPKHKLWITVHHGDDESADIWRKKIGIPAERLIRCGDEDNFWSMGDTGPCGPCSEIYYDHGEHLSGEMPGGSSDGGDGDRFVEIWNLVFMQFNRDNDGSLNPLPKPSVDTGMGLERIAAVLQGVSDNFETDELQHLIVHAKKLSENESPEAASLKVLADHIRSSIFLIVDGILPSNEGRGYVLRRIIRRALRHGQKISITETPFFHRLIPTVIDCMGEAYPALRDNKDEVIRVLFQEEEKFTETLRKGLILLERKLSEHTGGLIPGELVFHLYDTYGFPIDMIEDISRERDLKIDRVAFEQAMKKQKKRSRESMHFKQQVLNLQLNNIENFVGYEHLEVATEVVQLFSFDGSIVKKLLDDEEGIILLKSCPFYAESGGQVSDTGVIVCPKGSFQVTHVLKQGHTHLCSGIMQGEGVSLREEVHPKVDSNKRMQTQRSHSATHLLHMALREHLGSHITQKGSLVSEDRLRFDFSHPDSLQESDIQKIERLINQYVLRNDLVEITTMSFSESKKSGAIALFDEKYGDQVRMVKIGASVELCGGTHVKRTGDIGCVVIVNEGGQSFGIRRIEALCANKAVDHIQKESQIVRKISQISRSPREKLAQAVEKLYDSEKTLRANVKQLQEKLNRSQLEKTPITQINGYNLIIAHLDDMDNKGLRQQMDYLKLRVGQGIILLAAVNQDKGFLMCGLTKNLLEKFSASDILSPIAKLAGGVGGGRSDLAMAGAIPSKLSHALSQAEKIIQSHTKA